MVKPRFLFLPISASDTCGKTFAHSSSYRRHARTQCDSQTRKRRRKLWLPDESCRSDKEDEDGVAPLFNTVECETKGNINFVCLFPLLQGSISEQNLHLLDRPRASHKEFSVVIFFLAPTAYLSGRTQFSSAYA